MRAPATLLLVSLAALACVGLDAGRRARAARRDDAAVRAVVARLPAGDLALAGGARHLRFPSLEEPGAAFADGPASVDVDPAGGAVAPPREVYAAIAARPRGVQAEPRP